MADDAPKFALFVSSVEGRLVSPPGSPHSYIGAKLRSPEEAKTSPDGKKRGNTAPIWSPEVVVPITEGTYDAHRREWDKLIRSGDLVARTAEDFAAFQAKLEQGEKARDAELAKQAAEAETKAKAEADAKAKAEKKAAGDKAKAEQGGA